MANTCDGNRIPHTLSSATLPGNERRRAPATFRNPRNQASRRRTIVNR